MRPPSNDCGVARSAGQFEKVDAGEECFLSASGLDRSSDDATTESGASCSDTSTDGDNHVGPRSLAKARGFSASYAVSGRTPFAQGQFASVWRCRVRDERGCEELAAKCVEKGLLLERDIRNLFGHRGTGGEISLHREVRHPHIVELFAVFDETDTVFLVMEMCAGGDLAALLRARHAETGIGFPDADSARAAQHLLRALACLHDRHAIVHRDVKCENVVVRECDGHPLREATFKLCDFGLAVRLPAGGCLNGRAGSPGYVAPEVLSRESYGTEVDIWSAGAVLAAVTTGILLSATSVVSASSFSSVGAAALGMDLLQRQPHARPTAAQALQHPWICREAGACADAAPEVAGVFGAVCCRRRRTLA